MNTMHALLWAVGAAHLLVAAMNFFLPGRTDVRHGDYHVILRKR